MKMAGIADISPNRDNRPPGTEIDMLVIHYTGMPTAEAALTRLCDRAAKVSAHYLVHEDGAVVSLVPESERAWHAGVSYWRGNTDINARSIGIELVNPGHEFGYRSFPDSQFAALDGYSEGFIQSPCSRQTMRMRVSARLQAMAAPEAPAPMISTSTTSSAIAVSCCLDHHCNVTNIRHPVVHRAVVAVTRWRRCGLSPPNRW